MVVVAEKKSLMRVICADWETEMEFVMEKPVEMVIVVGAPSINISTIA
jgi:hypothetical protein